MKRGTRGKKFSYRRVSGAVSRARRNHDDWIRDTAKKALVRMSRAPIPN